MPITLSWYRLADLGHQWWFSATERQVRFDTYLFRIALVRIVPPLWRTPVHHSETSVFHAISCDTSVLRPCRRGRTL